MTNPPTEKAEALAEKFKPKMVEFCRELICRPSMSGEEGEVAELIRSEMEDLGYDDVSVDGAGNVIGLMKGSGGGKSVMLNSHMDHVHPGDESAWPHPPYSGELIDGCIWGRGASDTKGAIAAQVYSVAILRELVGEFAGDVFVVGVVLEELGGLGTITLVKDLHTDYAILGEGTSNQIKIGHRGRVGIVVQVDGISVHGSVPEKGVNPHYILAAFIERMKEYQLPESEMFGSASLAPTLYTTDQTSSNVTPGRCRLHLDYRLIPGEDPREVAGKFALMLEECLVYGSEADVYIPHFEARCYTGYSEQMESIIPSYGLEEDHPLVTSSRECLRQALGREIEVTKWDFATDGGHLMNAGIPTIGFSPCQEELAHTSQDRVSVDMMTESVVGHCALIPRLWMLR
jgi:putative selenium metabolism hydrolase